MQTLSTVGVDLQFVKRRIGDQNVVLQVWDTAGQERYRSLAESFFRGADGALVCYDVTRKVSFLSVKQWLSSLSKHVDACDVVLCGNKVDLAEESKGLLREVPTSAGEALAEELQAAFYETSAVTGTNVEAAFDAMAKALIARRVKKETAAATAAAVGDKRPSLFGGGKSPSAEGSAGPTSATAWKGKTKEVDLVDLASRPIIEEGNSGCSC
jgi:small GTP-binding protein